MAIEMNGKHAMGPVAFTGPTLAQQRKREQNVRYREKRKALMAAGKNAIEPTTKREWSDESRRKLSEAMKKAHAAKPDWKEQAKLKRGGWIPLDTTAATVDTEVQAEVRPDGKAYVRGPYRRKAPARSIGMKGLLIDAIRRELHEHVRAGHELTPFHTNVLALTDYLRNEDNDGNDGV